MSTPELNLARKYRPITLDGVIGQDKPLRMLKNSLYAHKFFPVYLFSGQRGCGKTSTARIFARAINCEALPLFQKNPALQPLPCQTCGSCLAMDRGAHPDFIEIDGASHTGVDNVRTIIEASGYLPLLGRKKIYLIDEAHMLSKAAFNAFLKILEEPPASVLFILATTEAQKIPATVVSRCFQARFAPIEQTLLTGLLRTICEQEKIAIDDEALALIAYESEGSARDALNLIERVRLSDGMIDRAFIISLLGKVNVSLLQALLQAVIAQQPTDLLTLCQQASVEQLCAQSIWDAIAQSLRTLIWIKFDVEVPDNPLLPTAAFLTELAQQCPPNRLYAMMQLLLHHEVLFMKASNKHLVLEMVLLLMCNQVNAVDLQELMEQCKRLTTTEKIPARDRTPTAPQRALPIPEKKQQAAPVQQLAAPRVTLPVQPEAQQSSQPAVPVVEIVQEPWAQFLVLVQEKDPMLHSIFVQAHFGGLDIASNKYLLALRHNNSFIRDNINDNTPLWKPLIKQCIPEFTEFKLEAALHNPVLSPSPRPSVTAPPPQSAQKMVPVSTQSPASRGDFKKSGAQTAQADVKDEKKWPFAHLILSLFPGKIRRKVFN